MEATKRDIRTLSKKDLEDFFLSKQQKSFRASQVHGWIWQKSAKSFDHMTNLSKSIREVLKQHFVILPIALAKTQKSKDGTIKNAIKLHDDLLVESVLIPAGERMTACVSSQVGCSLDCKFCATALLAKKRNLSAAEIYDQVVTLQQQSQQHYNQKLSNIVFMGMGEPLMNYKNVLAAIEKITSPQGLGMSAKRITLSTSGIPKMIRKMGDEKVKFNLAVSLHSAIDTVRSKIMPFNTLFPLEDLKEALQHWYAKTKTKVTYEYIVWKGINDTQKDIEALAKFCRYVPCKVNLIMYNPIANGNFTGAKDRIVEKYKQTLEKHNITTTIRKSRGQDIDAACGQLANKT